MVSGAIECMMGKWWTQPERGSKIFEYFEVHFRDPVGSMEGPRLVSDPMGVSSCVLRVPWYGFCCLEYKNMAYIVAPPPV